MKITSKTTKQELVGYAAKNLGAELDADKFSRDELIVKIGELQASLGIIPESNAEKEDASALEETTEARPKFCMLRIHSPASTNGDDDAEEQTHCIVGFNGKNYQIAYDVEDGVKVPYGVYDVIKNAVQTKYRRVKGKREMEMRKEQRYKFNVVKFIA